MSYSFLLYQFGAICEKRLSCNSLRQVIISLSTKFVETYGHFHFITSYGSNRDGWVDLNSNNQNPRVEKQNAKFKQWGHPENWGRPKNNNTPLVRRNRNNDEDQSPSSKRATSKRTGQTTPNKDQIMEAKRKELDEVKSAMKGKTAANLDGMHRRTNSPFIAKVLECPLPLKGKTGTSSIWRTRVG